MQPTTLLLRALEFAAAKHRDQRRKGRGASPYINHPIEVARALAELGGVTDPEILAAAILHDTVEDTKTAPEELEEVFGARIRSLVEEMTDDKSVSQPERKRLQIVHAPALSPGARLIKLGDKLCNVHDVIHDPPPSWDPVRRRAYLAWAKEVVDQIRGTNPELEATFDRLMSEGEASLES
jgi:GTP diphosphokinase / guanosine-3',5'-bis(diphosphate) 3'-diphosphatase